MNSGIFVALQTKDFASRKAFLEELRKEFDVTPAFNNNHNGVDHSDFSNNDSHDLHLNADDTSHFYPILLRLAYECPFKDVQFACEDILSKLEAKGIRVPRRKVVGPSRFISSKDCVSIETDDFETQSLFIEAFLLSGRTSHLTQNLAYHVRYLSCFIKFDSHLMREHGALPYDWRYYIGIMAASKHRCGYLVDECSEMFLNNQGNPKWLDGIIFAPLKLRKLDALNKLLAHQPWLIDDKIIKELLVGPSAETWTVSELIHAIVVMAHYLSLSGLIFSCGITAEIDTKNGHSIRSQSTGGYSSSGSEPLTPTNMRDNSIDAKILHRDEPGTTVGVYERIKRIQQEDEMASPEEGEEEDKLRQFQEIETKEFDESEKYLSGIVSNGYGDCSCDKFNEDNTVFHYEEYQKMKPKNVSVFREQDFNWQQHCFSFLNRSLPSMVFLMDEKFKCTSELTYRTVGDIPNIDTTKFRLATWNYIHLLYGIYHDDYLYLEVNKLLEKSYKSYIKKVACFPERITFVDFEFTDFLPSEKVHVNLLVLESRFQAILLYATRAIMSYMNKDK